MPILHFGVQDVPHLDQRHTTGDIADFLESKYGLFQVFYDIHEREILSLLAQSAANTAFDILRRGAPRTMNLYAGGAAKIKTMLREDIAMSKFDGRIPGVPTAAALACKSKRFKSGYTRGRRSRASFVDTGIFESDIAVWVTE
jgi:hypothetical protein